ncbi:MAG: hypothetical protein ACOC3T_03030 [Bacteroidota bacterium]
MKQNAFKYFIGQTLIISAVLILLGVIAFNMWEDMYQPVFPFMLLIILIITWIVHYMLLKAAEKDNKTFNYYFMFSIVGKMFIYLGLLTLYMLQTKEPLLPFVAVFGILYLIFSFIEIRSVLFYIKKGQTIR